MFSDSYHHEHRQGQYAQLSYAGGINLRVLHELEDTLRGEPKVNLLSAFPVNYTRRIAMATGARVLSPAEKCISESRAPDFRTRLDLAETASVIFPLSEKVASLLAQSGGSAHSGPSDAEESLLLSLKTLLWESPKLWENCARGMVVKCSEDLVAKVITGNEDYTEYTSLRFLEEWAPEIPAPRPHGFVIFGPFRVIFMSCIPGMTLAQAWPSLSHDEKLSIQRQLDEVFRRLRTIRQDDGKALGGVCGEGVKEIRVYQCTLSKGITTAVQFSDLQFSARHYGSSTYVEFLRSFLENDPSTSMPGSVFTHGDIRTANIMVKQDANGRYIVTGILDWEYSGFYPEYYECIGLTRTLSLVDEDDWYLYLPESISPSQFSVRWLVDRLPQYHIAQTRIEY